MRKIILILILFNSYQAFSQIYFARKNWSIFYVEMNKDSARVELFYNSYPDFNFKECDEILSSNKLISDTVFIGKHHQILKTHDNYYLLYKTNHGRKSKKIRLELCGIEERTSLRKLAYSSDKRIKIMQLQDSLSGPNNVIHFDINNPITQINTNKYSESDYNQSIDCVSDSLIKKILLNRSSSADYFYSMTDSLDKIDSTKVFELLAEANYSFYYGQYFLYQVSLQKPDYLISYIDRNPSNLDTLLKAIKNHNDYNQINRNVKKSSLDSKGKHKILKQKRKRVVRDIAIGTAYITIVVSELALLTMFFVWIF